MGGFNSKDSEVGFFFLKHTKLRILTPLAATSTKKKKKKQDDDLPRTSDPPRFIGFSTPITSPDPWPTTSDLLLTTTISG